MSPANRSANLKDEWALAPLVLHEAEVLVRERLYNGAASRAYYAVFHAARAALYGLGHEPRTHRGLQMLFRRHLVEPGLLPAEIATALAELYMGRDAADYGANQVSETTARTALAQARATVGALRAFLVKQGWID